MNILMLTNTFTPHVGGVAQSVQAFTQQYQQKGHRTVIVAPTFDEMPNEGADVVRVPAIEHFVGSDFSLPVPLPGVLHQMIEQLHPDIIHSHHPFLLGDTALRISAARNIPVVFTNHTQYDKYTHYMKVNSPAMGRFITELATGYANLCDAVIAPSETIATMLCTRGVEAPIEVIPTGVDLNHFSQGNGAALRKQAGIPPRAFVIGHIGRLAPEKNLEFLTKAVAQFLLHEPNAWFLVAGVGPLVKEIRQRFQENCLANRLVILGNLNREDLSSAYHAMDVFAFASQSETQGMVLTEAMASGLPVVALDAPGVREVVSDQHNGRLLRKTDLDTFVEAFFWIARLSPVGREAIVKGARSTAEEFSISRSANKALQLYSSLIAAGRTGHSIEDSLWVSTLRRIEEEWKIWSNVADAFGAIGTRHEAKP